MEARECIVGRRSVRSFNDQPISRETIEDIIAMSAYAPSWKNSQTVSYVVIEGDLKERIANEAVLSHAGNQRNVTTCATLMAVITKKGICGYNPDGSFSTSKGDRWESFDAGIATQTLCLAAHIHHVGSVIMGLFDDAKVGQMLDLDPDEYVVAALVALGNYDSEPKAPKRKSVAELLSYRS